MTPTHRIGRRAATVLMATAALTCAGVLALSAGIARAYQTTVTVSPTTVTKPLPQGFVGLAFTYSALTRWMSDRGPVDPVLVRLIRNLTPVGRPWLRIGGESADRSWWPIKGYRKPIGITYELGPGWTAVAHRLARATNARLMLGLELEADRPAIDRVEARQLLRRVGRRYVQSFQIGNEPELYPSIPWYRRLHGHNLVWYSHVGTPVYARSRTYGPARFVAEVSRIMRAIPRYPIAGPETNVPSWMQAFVRFLRPTGRVTTLTTHEYGVNNCIRDPDSIDYPTIANMLSLHASRALLRGMAPYVSLVHARRGSYRIDEMGAITCSGRPGVSDSMATALWAIDALFDAARHGVDGVNLHSDYDRINNLFALRFARGRWRATVRPIYYGALLFERADPAGSRLLRVAGGSSRALRVWASRRGHMVRVAIVNDSLRDGGTIHLRFGSELRGRSAALQRLLAPGGRGAYATHGVTLGGRSFGQTATGALGAPRQTTVRRRGDEFTVGMPKGSAALLTINAR